MSVIAENLSKPTVTLFAVDPEWAPAEALKHTGSLHLFLSKTEARQLFEHLEKKLSDGTVGIHLYLNLGFLEASITDKGMFL